MGDQQYDPPLGERRDWLYPLAKYAIIGILAGAATLVSVPKLSIKLSWQESEEASRKIKPDGVEYDLSEGAEYYLSAGFSRMRLCGTQFTYPEHSAIYDACNAPEPGSKPDQFITTDEAEKAYNTILNPSHPLGKLSLPFDGRLSAPTLEQRLQAERVTAENQRWHAFVQSRIDKNKDHKISEEEKDEAIAKIFR